MDFNLKASKKRHSRSMQDYMSVIAVQYCTTATTTSEWMQKCVLFVWFSEYTESKSFNACLVYKMHSGFSALSTLLTGPVVWHTPIFCGKIPLK